MLESHLKMQFMELEECAESVENLLFNEIKNLTIRVEKNAATMSDEDKTAYFEDVASDEYFQLQESFPQTIRISLFVHSYSLFEHSLTKLTNRIYKDLNLELDPKELKDVGIIRAKTYLQKVAHVGFPENHPAWGEIIILNKIRNLYVHQDGFLPTEGKPRTFPSERVCWCGQSRIPTPKVSPDFHTASKERCCRCD